MRKLNRKKPFGTVHGYDEAMPKNASYSQNGLYFDQNGLELEGYGKYVEVDETDRADNSVAEVAMLKAKLAKLEGKDDVPDEEAPSNLDRMQIIADLQDLGVHYSGSWKTETLYKKLQEALDKNDS